MSETYTEFHERRLMELTDEAVSHKIPNPDWSVNVNLDDVIFPNLVVETNRTQELIELLLSNKFDPCHVLGFSLSAVHHTFGMTKTKEAVLKFLDILDTQGFQGVTAPV